MQIKCTPLIELYLQRHARADKEGQRFGDLKQNGYIYGLKEMVWLLISRSYIKPILLVTTSAEGLFGIQPG